MPIRSNAPKIRRLQILHGRHYKAITFICGLRLRGVVAPKAYDRAMNAETFEAWLEHHLLPTLEEGDIVVLDNLKAHKSPRVAEILARKGCMVRYLPPYSPDFNPIENAYSKLKSALRKLAERTVAGLMFSPGLLWSGLSLNRFGWEVHALEMNS
jgi:transposase